MWIGLGARFLTGSALVYDAHELWPDRNLRPEPRWWLSLCESIFVRVADRVITTSPGYAEVMARRYRIGSPTVVRNICEVEPPASDGRARRPLSSPPTAVYVGGLTRNRGLEQCIAALAQLPEIRLRAIGPGAPAYREVLLALARELRVAARVTIEEPVAPDQVVGTIADADVGLAMIQPSCLSYELSLPNKLFEYLAAGLPILGSDAPVIASFVTDHGIGAAARATDPADIATKLAAILEPAENDRLRAASARAREELSWDEESRLLISVYEGASSRAGR
jgi:glycosyltransferase involved in cell wall biosynthesis